jgi:predicted MPP superfamily phosphohydrolase
MKNRGMLIFLLIVLSVYTLVNFYIFRRGNQALEYAAALRPWYYVLFSVVFLSFIVGRVLMKVAPGAFASAMIWIGSFWLSCMLFFFLAIVLFDLLRLFNHWFHFFPGFITGAYARSKLIAAGITVFIVFIVIVAGTINAYHPVVRKVNIDIPKKAGSLQELHAVMVSDVHLGTIVGRRRFSNIVEKINALQPDIILLAGDVVDEDIEPVIRLNLGEMLKSLQSKYGTWACPGNHEYIGGAAKAFAYLKEHNVHLLRDSVVMIDSSFYLAGRDDKDNKRFHGTQRKEVDELLKDVNRSFPILLMDHQPFWFEKAEAAGVDFQLSGHTHVGQMWPFSYITHAMYETDYGYLRKGEAQFYVSSGVGTWGPPVRIGNRPEIVDIHIRFTGKQ